MDNLDRHLTGFSGQDLELKGLGARFAYECSRCTHTHTTHTHTHVYACMRASIHTCIHACVCEHTCVRKAHLYPVASPSGLVDVAK
jgi:hypothetical protein